MNISTRTIAAATATLGMLLVATACGTESVSETDPGNAPVANRIYPPTEIPSVPMATPKRTRVSPDEAERQAQEDKARAERADALRAAQGAQHENKLAQSSRTRHK